MKNVFNAYIDGFNLYKGALQRNPELKWLDLVKFCELSMPDAQLAEIYYFTARVKERYIGDRAPQRQHAYLRVLQDQGVNVQLGKFRKDVDWTRVVADKSINLLEPPLPQHLGLTQLAFANSTKNALPDRPKTQTQTFEEKGSDVNLASYLLRDAFLHNVAVQLVVTGDSDLLTPIRFSVENGVTVHTLVPNQKQRVDALSMASSTLGFIEPELLRISQLTDLYITKRGGVIKKPIDWT